MTQSVTITHHAAKPEYQWEIVVPEGPTVLLRQESFPEALTLLGLQPQGGDTWREIEELPNGGSQSVDANLADAELRGLVHLSVKSV